VHPSEERLSAARPDMFPDPFGGALADVVGGGLAPQEAELDSVWVST